MAVLRFSEMFSGRRIELQRLRNARLFTRP
jgi:hypothetical protein